MFCKYVVLIRHIFGAKTKSIKKIIPFVPDYADGKNSCSSEVGTLVIHTNTYILLKQYGFNDIVSTK